MSWCDCVGDSTRAAATRAPAPCLRRSVGQCVTAASFVLTLLRRRDVRYPWTRSNNGAEGDRAACLACYGLACAGVAHACRLCRMPSAKAVWKSKERLERVGVGAQVSST